MKNEFVLAFNEVLDEKQLPRDTIIKALESAMVSAYRKAVTASAAQHVEAKLDPESGNFVIYAEKEVVDSVVDDRTEVVLEEARKVNPEAQYGDMVIVETTPKNFGRVAAQTARQVIQQRIRDAERMDQISFYSKQVGEIVNGVVQSINSEGIIVGLDKKAEGTILRKDMIRGERFRMHDRVRALVVDVKDNPRAPMILLSRTHRDFLRRLLENEVPEIFHGIVEIRSITREPGERAKIAVSATQQGIDPVGACVGLRGVRIQTIVRELHDEKIDVIEWNPDPTIFIAKAISPARVVGVYLGEGKNATVIVPEDQLSLAIGRDGQNARLAAKLTGWRIDIKSVMESAAELIHLYESGEGIQIQHEDSDETETIPGAELFEKEEAAIEDVRTVLARKEEGRPLSPEEIETVNRFVDRVEKRKVARVHVISVVDVLKELSDTNPTKEDVAHFSIMDCGLPKHVCEVLRNAGYKTLDDLNEAMKRDPEEIYKLQGVTPKTMSDIATIINFIGTFENKTSETPAEAEEAEIAAETSEETEKPEAEESTEPREEGTESAQPERFDEKSFTDLTQEETAQAEEKPAAEEEPGEEVSFDELFNSVQTDIAKQSFYPEDEESKSEGDADKTSAKKKKKKKGVEIEYDPDRDETTVRRKHKRGDDEWGW